MTLQLTFDQTTLGTAGVAGRARTDILSTGPVGTRAYEVQIAISGVPDGATADIVLLDEPPSSNPLLTQVDPLNWTLAFDKDCWGPFRVRCRAVNAGAVVQSVTRRISIRSPVLGIAYPANAERIDPNASSVATVQSVALTEMNEGGTNRPLVDFYRQVVEALEGAGGGGGGALLFLPGIVVDAAADLALGGITRAALTDHNVVLTVPAGAEGDRFGVKLVASAGDGPPYTLRLAATGTDLFENPGDNTFVSPIDLGNLPGLYVEFLFDAVTGNGDGEGIWQLMNLKMGHWIGGG